MMRNALAVTGMVCHVPGAEDIDAFWNMLCGGREGLRALSPSEISPDVRDNPAYVAAGGFIDGIDLFDAAFFSLSMREAGLMDPQHRLWLQACWQALEVSGLAGRRSNTTGVFASTGPAFYFHEMLARGEKNPAGHQAMLLGNVPDCLATRVSFALNLTGPSLTVQSGCSSSLVALHQARLALLAKQCDAALVGGICLTVPHYQGYYRTEGGIVSPDGHCRPFSADAAGTVFASGYGVLVLRRLEDALAQGDYIYGVIRGSAINNDGAAKASFTAPGVQGQAAVIGKALRVAGLSAGDLQYIETHGTGTPIGDPIELTALTEALQQTIPAAEHRWMLGALKANIGHLDVASGIVGLIKTCLMLQHQQIPPQIHFREWHTNCVALKKHFIFQTELGPWLSLGKRRAGVSAFGFGGTNAHVIVEEAPDNAQRPLAPHPVLSQLIVLSALSPERLISWANLLCEWLQKNPHVSVSTLACTLQTGRKQFPARVGIVGDSIADIIQKLKTIKTADIVTVKTLTPVWDIRHRRRDDILQLWLQAGELDWHAAWQGFSSQKMILPPAPLQPLSCWYKSASDVTQGFSQAENRAADWKQWLYQPAWQEVPVRVTETLETLQPVVLFSVTQTSWTDALMHHFLQNKIPAQLVTQGNDFRVVNPSHTLIRTAHFSDYEKLIALWSETGDLPKTFLFIFSENPSGDTASTLLRILFQLIRLPVCIRPLTNVAVITDTPVEGAVFTGFFRSIGQEFPAIKTRMIHVDPAQSVLQGITHITDSLRDPTLLDLIKWRDQQCWQQTWSHPGHPAQTGGYFRKGGIYLVTGGLGDVASVHVNFLAREYAAQLMLVGRTPIPAPSEWPRLLKEQSDETLRKKIARLNLWREAGYQVNAFVADVTSLPEMEMLCEKIIRQYGRIDGIVHTAGPGSDMHYKMLTDMDWVYCTEMFSPRLAATEVIGRLCDRFSIADCLIISSISTVLSGMGLGAYSASHNLLDANVRKKYPHWRIMNWDAWSFYQTTEKHLGGLGSDIDRLAIRPEQGEAILHYAFQLPGWCQLYVSAANLTERYHHWAKRGFICSSQKKPANTLPRPPLQTEYRAAQTPLQQRLAVLWQALLGIEKIGMHDSFFELGGDSLLALELITRLNTEFHYNSSAIELFEAPTIAQLEQKMKKPAGNTDDALQSTVQTRRQKQLAALKHFQAKQVN